MAAPEVMAELVALAEPLVREVPAEALGVQVEWAAQEVLVEPEAREVEPAVRVEEQRQHRELLF